MDFATAAFVCKAIDETYPDLKVAGFRRTNFDMPESSWAIDILDPGTGRMETLDEKDGWTERLERAFPNAIRHMRSRGVA
jgi:hypothetical protein